MNSQKLQTQEGKKKILDLIFRDGLCPSQVDDEVAEAYAKEITGRSSKTAVNAVKRHARSIYNSAINQ